MTPVLLLLAILTTPAGAGSRFPEFLEPLATSARTEEPATATVPMISAKVRVAVPDVQQALETAPDSVIALGAKGLQATGNARAAFLFKPAPPAELRAKLKQAVKALGKLGVVSGYKEELLPPLEMRTAQLAVQLDRLKEERKALAKALEVAPLSAKVIDDEIARLAALRAEEEPRQAVLTAYFDQENSAVTPDPEALERAKDGLKERRHQDVGEPR